MEKYKQNYQTLISWRAQHQPDTLAYVFINKFGEEETCVTFAELDQRVRSIALQLQQRNAAGKRVLIVLENNIDYVVAFYSCVYANAVAVTMHPPRTKSQLDRMVRISSDCDAKFVLTSSKITENSKWQLDKIDELKDLQFIDIDAVPLQDAKQWTASEIDPEDIALLQYTSGSTSAPKGVMVTHENLRIQGEYLKAGFDLTENDTSVTWLPQFHDMGLIIGVLQSCYMGFTTYLMEPITFIRKPAIWLQTVSKYGGTWSAAPNFAFDLCVETYRDSDYRDVDLSTWKGVINAAEPVRRATVEKFTECFAKHGFRPEYLNPSYGMAETTLEISSGDKGSLPIFKKLDLQDFQQHKVSIVDEQSEQKTLDAVACGKVRLDTQIAVVNNNGDVCRSDEIGELWIKGKTVAKGYWQNPQETQNIFQAYLKNGDGPYLRTGDLGFVHEEQIYITGRSKDIIIIHGKNHAPQDIEFTIEKIPEIERHFVAAFSLEIDQEERLIIFAQINKAYADNFDKHAVARKIFNSVVLEHEVAVFEVVFLEKGILPKTTSGKIQRSACKNIYKNEIATLNLVKNPHFR